jgi:hypothetical protein
MEQMDRIIAKLDEIMRKIELIEESINNNPIVEDITCPKCGRSGYVCDCPR